jgi:hypothetical protein
MDHRHMTTKVSSGTVVKLEKVSGVLRITDKKGIALSCGCQPRATLLDHTQEERLTIYECHEPRSKRCGRAGYCKLPQTLVTENPETYCSQKTPYSG